MGPNLYILLGPALAVAASMALGRLVVRASRAELHREEEYLLGFIIGAACLSALVAAMAAVNLGRRGAFVGLAAMVVALALWRTREPAAKRLPRLEWRWIALVAPLFAIFGTLYLENAMATQPQGGERILFLFVFSFGRHASAAVMHMVFLVSLSLTVFCYGRRYGMPGAGAFAAVAVFTSPVAGVAATCALDDAALACAAFAIFYLLRQARFAGALRIARGVRVVAAPLAAAGAGVPLAARTGAMGYGSGRPRGAGVSARTSSGSCTPRRSWAQAAAGCCRPDAGGGGGRPAG